VGGLLFVANLADWSVQNDALMEIRSRERYARTLAKLTGGEKVAWEIGHFGFVILAIGIIGLVMLGSRGRARPMLGGRASDRRGGVAS
jgi:hypothetical protein